jgi:hypothetical protein
MNGDLSIAPPPAAVDLAPRARAARQGPSRPAARPELAPAEVVQPPAGEWIEAARIKDLLTDSAMRVSTHHDRESGHLVLSVLDRETGEVVEQFPSDRLLNLFATLRESLVDEQA